jgi:hypothetical protein
MTRPRCSLLTLIIATLAAAAAVPWIIAGWQDSTGDGLIRLYLVVCPIAIFGTIFEAALNYKRLQKETEP